MSEIALKMLNIACILLLRNPDTLCKSPLLSHLTFPPHHPEDLSKQLQKPWTLSENLFMD